MIATQDETFSDDWAFLLTVESRSLLLHSGHVYVTNPTTVTLSSFAAKSSAGLVASLAWLWLVGVLALIMGGVVWVR
jgi:hypothetical protein